MKLDLIYTEDDLIISKQHQDWRVWQEKFDDYKASLSFQGAFELADFLRTEYNLSGLDSEKIWNDIKALNSDLLLLELPEDKAGSLNFKTFDAKSSH